MELGQIVRQRFRRGKVEHLPMQPVVDDQRMCQRQSGGLHRMIFAVVEAADGRVVEIAHSALRRLVRHNVLSNTYVCIYVCLLAGIIVI